MSATTATPDAWKTGSRWFTTVLILLALIGLFNVFAAASDRAATSNNRTAQRPRRRLRHVDGDDLGPLHSRAPRRR